MAKKILEVFNTATDAYLEYKNKFITKEKFTEFYDLDEDEVEALFKARKCLMEGDTWMCIDYYFQKDINKNYTERTIHY